MDKRVIKKILMMSAILLNVYIWHLILEFYFFKPNVTFLNVFEGDSAIIMNKSGNVMIDAGRRNYVLKPLADSLPFFEKIIDVILISHADSDHFEGLNFILDNYKIRTIVLNDFDNNNENYIKLLEKIVEKDITMILGIKGMEIKTDGLQISCLYPNRNELNIKKTNDKSEILLINTLGKRWLFTGDVTDKILKTVIDQESIKNIDILKVPHHGGKNTINADILSQLGVKKAIISVGTNNYGHPNSDIVKLIESAKAEVLRTDIFGNIKIGADN